MRTHGTAGTAATTTTTGLVQPRTEANASRAAIRGDTIRYLRVQSINGNSNGDLGLENYTFIDSKGNKNKMKHILIQKGTEYY